MSKLFLFDRVDPSAPGSPLCAQLSSLKELADGLKEQLSREKSGAVQNKLRVLLRRREKIKQLSVKRREELELSKLLCSFSRDVSQVQTQAEPLLGFLSRVFSQPFCVSGRGVGV